MPRPPRTILPFVISSSLSVCSCASPDADQYRSVFAQLTHPQSEWRPDDFGRLPDQNEARLLQKYAPRYWIHRDECAPMDFYQQYLPLLTLKTPEGSKSPLTRSLLKENERNFQVELELSTDKACIDADRPPLYAYSWQETLKLPGQEPEPIRILKYAFTFYKSGLPADLNFIQSLEVLGSADIWHYLDIHGAVFYLLDAKERLFAVVLAQHNHFRSYIIGLDIPEGEAQKICFAIRSNEPYFCHDKKIRFPSAPTFADMRWIVTGKDKPFLGAHDVIPFPHERREISYRLDFLPDRDPLITSWIPLGPEIKIWGIFSSFYRTAPPGMAIFNTPRLRELGKTAQYFYFDPQDPESFGLHEEHMTDFLAPTVEPVLKRNGERFARRLNRRQP